VTDPAQMPVREARPRSPKPPRWSAERRASRVMGTQGASQAPDTPRHGVSNGCRCTRTFLGAPLPLDRGLAKQRGKNPGAKNAPRERGGLFEK
jgi:hypothetical protein